MAGSLTPSGILNQALDAIGWPDIVGDIEEGTHQAQVGNRAYGECLKQLLRAAPWDFARIQAPLTLLADASGNTANVGTIVPQGFLYEYIYPTNCAKMRFVLFNLDNPSTDIPAGNIQIPSTPLVDGLGNMPIPMRIQPARFLVASDFNYPIAGGVQPWDVPGVSPQGRTVILTNVRNANAVYTAQMIYPSVWDALFRSAFVAYLASEIALPIWAKKDPKMGIMMRNEQIPIVKAKITEARLTAANEGGPPTSDLAVDWMRARRSGGAWNGGWGSGGWNDGLGLGTFGSSYDSLQLSGGAVF